MRRVFLDTVGLVGLWDEDDPWHVAASQAFDNIIAKRVVVVTTTFVLLECGNAVARTPYRLAVDQLRETLVSGGRMIVPTAEDWDEAWAGYRTQQMGDAGIVDYVSFVVMRRMQITDAFTNDRHFKAARFHTLF